MNETQSVDFWFIVSCILTFFVTFLLTENFFLRKYKRLWNAYVQNSAQAQINFANQMQFGKPKIKDVN